MEHGEHKVILFALYNASAENHAPMNAERWLAKIQHEVHASAGFYPALHQVRYALKKMVKRGDMLCYFHERGWYRWYTYKWNPDRIPF